MCMFPTFFSRQVLTNDVFGLKMVPSGTVTSATKAPTSHNGVGVGRLDSCLRGCTGRHQDGCAGRQLNLRGSRMSCRGSIE